MAVLPDQHDPLLLVQRDDHRGAGMGDGLADGDLAVGHPHVVLTQAEDVPGVDLLGVLDLITRHGIGSRAASE